MTHHNLNKDNDNKNKEMELEDDGNYIDQSEVAQGQDIVPIESDTTADIPDTAFKEKKDKKSGQKTKEVSSGSNKGAAELSRMKDKIRCGFCGVNMSHGGTLTVVPVTGKKIPKNSDGKFRFRSPGAESDGKMVGVLCEACKGEAERLPKGAIDIKSVIAVSANGQVRNIPVRKLQ